MTHVLERLLRGEDLSEDEAAAVCESLARDAVPAPLTGALLTALRVKGETPDEVRGFARAMRSLARRPALPAGLDAVDIVGTGGDGSQSVNLSTGAALLAAACGAPVVKHGNRSVSSQCGSADVLEALGLRVPLDEDAAARCLARTGFTFLFAPHYHPAMAAVAPVRRALGVRTVFNLLGPLTNPAAPPFLVIGAYSEPAAELIAHAVAGLPITRAMVVHSANGWDEPTPAAPFTLFDVRPGRITRTERDPQDAGVARCDAEALAGADAALNAERLRAALGGVTGPVQDALVLGAALALEVTGRGASPREGVAQARAAIASGAAGRLLAALPEAHA